MAQRASARIKFQDFPKVCRLCLARAKTLTSIYLNINGTSFENTILEFSGVQVAEIDGLPMQICKKCANFLAAATTFKKKACESDKFLRDILDKYRVSCTRENEHIGLPSYQQPYGRSKGSNSSTSLDEADPSELDDPLNIDMKFEAIREANAQPAVSEYLVETEPTDPLSDTNVESTGPFCIITAESSESILPDRQNKTRKTTERVDKFFRSAVTQLTIPLSQSSDCVTTSLHCRREVASPVEQVDVAECFDGDADMPGPAPTDPLTTRDDPEELEVASPVEQVDVAECFDGDADMPGPVPTDPLTTRDDPEELEVASPVEQVDVAECFDGDADMPGPATTDPLTTRDDPEELNVHCDVCSERFASRTELRDHRRFIGHRRFGCAACPRRFERKQNLAQHIAKEHPAPAEPAAKKPTEPQQEPTGLALEEHPVSVTQAMRDILEPKESVAIAHSLLEEQLESEVQSVLVEHVPKERLPPQQELCQPQQEQSASDKEAEPKQCPPNPSPGDPSPADPDAVVANPSRRKCNLCGRFVCRTADCTIQVEVCVPCIRESQPDFVADANEVGAVAHLCNTCGRMQDGTRPCTLLVQACPRCIRNARPEGQAADGKESVAKDKEPTTKETEPSKVTGSVSKRKASSDSEELSSDGESSTSSSQSSWSEEGFVKPIPRSQTWPLLDASDTSVIRLRSGSVVAARIPPPPKAVACSVCAEEFPTAADRKQHELATMHNRVMCYDCDPERSFAKYSLDKHREEEHSATPCIVCGEVFSGRLGQLAHQKETMHGLFPCEQCNDRVDHGSWRALKKHMRWTHQPRRLANSSLLCPHCGMTMVSGAQKSMELHILMHSHFTVRGKAFTCNVCQTMMSKNMVLHLARVHEVFIDPSMSTGLCSQCGVRVMLRELPRHTELHRHFSGTGDMSVCNICNEGVRRVAQTMHLKDHKVFLESLGLVFCADCGEGFAKKMSLIRHLDSHVVGLVHCDECDTTFPDGKALHIHRRAKHYQRRGLFKKPHACPICKKKFRRKEYVTRHLRSHTGEKPFVCPTCNRAFSLRPNLVAHMRQHTDEAPYKCPVCGKGFKHNVSRKNHMKYHEDLSLQNSQKQDNQNVGSNSDSGDNTDT